MVMLGCSIVVAPEDGALHLNAAMSCALPPS